MINVNKMYLEYKAYIETNSQYDAKVVKDFNYNNSHFPVVDFSYDDSINTNQATIGGIEYYDREYFIITIYTTDKGSISRHVITEEIKKLTQKFMGEYMGMERKSCKSIPNIDKRVSRTLMTYRCYKGNIYNNIIRRTL